MNEYSAKEERINVQTHALGVVLSIVALVLLVVRAGITGNGWYIVSFAIFGVSLTVLYTASTLYHRSSIPEKRKRLKVFDHAAIYALIAGTYSPYTLVTLNGLTGWVIFSIVWSLAIAGITLKLYFTGRYKVLSTLMYVFMGWIIIFAIKPLMDNLSGEGLRWLFAGGVFYTIGAILYSIKRIDYNHAIFHVFVLLGSFCHFISIYLYV